MIRKITISFARSAGSSVSWVTFLPPNKAHWGSAGNGLLSAPRNDFMKRTICQRSGSGSLDQSGIPRRTTPFDRIQNSAPGVACCTCSFNRLGPLFVPCAFIP